MKGSLTIKADDILNANLSTDCVTTTIHSGPTHVSTPSFKTTTNCRNCGAPLNRNRDCEYCGTKHQMKSEIVMNGHEIRMSCG